MGNSQETNKIIHNTIHIMSETGAGQRAGAGAGAGAESGAHE